MNRKLIKYKASIDTSLEAPEWGKVKGFVFVPTDWDDEKIFTKLAEYLSLKHSYSKDYFKIHDLKFEAIDELTD